MDDKPVVLIMAAGLGTRMKSRRAKVLHEVAGRPMIVWAVETALAAGAARVVTILGHQRDEVQELLDRRYGEGEIGVAVQAEQRGTGHAVQCALPDLENEPIDRVVVILTGDAPLLRPERVAELAAVCRDSDAGMALLSTHPPGGTPYGRLVRDESGRLVRIVEDSDASPEQRAIREMNAGFYAIRLRHLREDVRALSSDNAQGELYLTDLAERAADRGGAAVIDAPFGEVSGINDRVDLARVDTEARRRINEALMREGVTMPAPDQVFIDAECGPFGTDVWLGPGVCLRGTTRLGAGARVDAGSVLTDVVVGDDTWIKPHSILSDAIIGEGAQIGPFTHCRPGTRVDEGARVGNFVETKKSHIMAGAKANHLAYLGDSTVGAKANIGAGTITCNYDGFKKYKTVIEAGAFIGSDTQLVAPVTVGRDCYVGAGSTITKDVPRAALALSRTRQVNLAGWADRFREKQGIRTKRSGGADDQE